MSFALDLSRFGAKTNAKIDAVVRKIVLEVGTSLVMKSPVGDPELWAINQMAVRYNDDAAAENSSDSMTIYKPPGYVGGRFRGNWQLEIGGYSTANNAPPDKSGRPTINKMDKKVGFKGVGGRIHYITNSVPYALKLENGHSKQAPNGMVRLTVNEFKPIVEAAARALNQ